MIPISKPQIKLECQCGCIFQVSGFLVEAECPDCGKKATIKVQLDIEAKNDV